MKKIRLTTAQALVKFLDQQYVSFNTKEHKFIEGIWTIFGHGNVVGLGEALAETKHNLKFHQAYNEQSMGHIAIAFAKQNKYKKIYAVSSSVGPGSTNMVTAAATATANRVPTLFLLGDVFSNRQPDPVLQQIEQINDLSISANDSFKSVSVYWDRIDHPSKLMLAMINAMRSLTDPSRYGAVTICLPQDVQGQTLEFPKEFFKKRIHKIETLIISDDKIQEIIQMIENARQPLFICGGGVKSSGAEKALIQIIDKTKIPLVETQAGKGSILSNHEFNLGGIGVTGIIGANLYASNADLVIGLGTRYSDFTTASKSLFKNTTSFINVNISRFDAYKMDGLPIVADINYVLTMMLKSIKNTLNKKNKEMISKYKKQNQEEIHRLFNVDVKNINTFQPEINDLTAIRQIKNFYKKTNSYYTQTNAIGVINQVIDKNSIVVSAAGSLPGDLQRIWQTQSINSYHVEYGYSCMGYEIAGALGCKFAEPNREIYAMLGDGSYMMLHSALLTSIQENKKINVLLFNNSSFGCINNLQVEKGITSLGTEFKKRTNKNQILDGEIMHVNFSKQAKPYGVKTYRVKTREELTNALLDAKKEMASTLIEILVLPKTMTHGYNAWWRVGNPKFSKSQKVMKATQNDQKNKNKLKGY